MVLSAVIFGHRLRLYKITFAIILITGITLVIQPPQLFPHHPKENNATYVGQVKANPKFQIRSRDYLLKEVDVHGNILLWPSVTIQIIKPVVY